MSLSKINEINKANTLKKVHHGTFFLYKNAWIFFVEKSTQVFFCRQIK